MKKKATSKPPARTPQSHGKEGSLQPLSQTASNAAALFAQALALHQAGRFGDAEACYKEVLAVNGKDLNTLNNLGTLYLQHGRLEEGVRLVRKSLEIDPNQPYAHMNLGNALRDLGRPREALASHSQAVALNPDLPQAYYNRGNAFSDLNRMDDALADYDRAIALKPDYVQAHYNRGNVLKELQSLEEAVASYDRAIHFNRDYVQAYYNRSFVLNSLKRLSEALADCDRAIALEPDFAEARYNRGNVLHGLKRLNEALASYDRAIELRPDYADAYCNRGNVLKDLKHLQQAVASYDRAISLNPDNADAYNNLGNVLQKLNRHDEAASSYDRAIAIHANLPYALGSWLHSRMHCCNWDDLDRAYAKLIHAVELGEKASTPFFFLAIPSSPALQQQCARTYVNDKYPESSTPVWAGERSAHGRIRVGYFSSDLRDHAMGYLIGEMIERHDRAKFEIIAFSFSRPSESPMRQRLEKAFDRFVDVSTLSDHEVAMLSRQLEIDIAIDLNGFTANSRTAVFAMRPAPIQVNHLGYPGTMGAEYIDYIIADQTVIPKEHSSYYTEQIVYLPDTYWFNDSTKVISDRSFSRAELGLPDHAFVFCCFNNNYKITPDLFDIWMRLLCKLEESVLWLLEGNATAARNLRLEAEKRGVSPDRLVFAPRMGLADHLARHRQADLFLDTFYYNAHTTASDALWTGLPVLTCLGETFAGRVAGSLLNAIGLPELITQSHDEYETLAIELASNAPRLAAIKTKLAKNRLTYPLFDTVLFTRHIEAAYTIMWERHQAGLPPNNVYAVARN
jgi:predicted O-linked N-acetylglucosamine transferase (SPINDLY family)